MLETGKKCKIIFPDQRIKKWILKTCLHLWLWHSIQTVKRQKVFTFPASLNFPLPQPSTPLRIDDSIN